MTDHAFPGGGLEQTPVSERPTGSEFLSHDEWIVFVQMVRDGAAALQMGVTRIEGETVRLRCGRSIALLQLAQHCRVRPACEWAELIASHLRTVTAHLDAVDEPFSMFDLRVRLLADVPADATMFRRLGARPFADGIVQVLAVDVGLDSGDAAVRSVSTSEIEARSWIVDEAWASARAQTELFEVPDEIHVVDLGGAQLIHVFGERSYTAGMVGVVDRLVAATAHIGHHGAIVSLPLRHSILVHPIRDTRVGSAITGMIPIARRLFEQGPGSLSPHLYWWRDGVLDWIPTFFDGTVHGVEFYPSDELRSLVDDLTR